MRLALVRGDHRLNEIKLQNVLGSPFRPATEEEIRRAFGAAAGLHRPGRSRRRGGRRRIARAGRLRHRREPRRVAPARRGARARLQRHASPTSARVEEGDRCPLGGTIRIEPAIEVGNIFKLGTRYSEPLGATFLDEDGAGAPDRDGQLRHRPGADRARPRSSRAPTSTGSPGRKAIAPFDVHLVGLGKPGSAEHELAERLYTELAESGFDVLYDDRDVSPGEKFVEAELLGCPLRVVAGKRSLESGELEVQVRRGMRGAAVPLEGAAERAARAVEGAGVGVEPSGRVGGLGRLLGLRRRSRAGADARGPAASAAHDPEPRRLPPDRVADRRLPGDRAFLRRRPRHRSRPLCFVVAAAADYLDGLLARLTGQYSRLGRADGPAHRPCR